MGSRTVMAGVEKRKSLTCNGVRMNRRPALFLKIYRSGTGSEEHFFKKKHTGNLKKEVLPLQTGVSLQNGKSVLIRDMI